MASRVAHHFRQNPGDLDDLVGAGGRRSLAFVLLLGTTAMFAKASALCLLVLILLPFSAPFSTCDLASLLPETHAGDEASHPVRSGWPAASIADAATSHALPFVRTASRMKLFTASPPGSRGLAVVLPASRIPRAIAAARGAASSVSNIPLRI